MGVASRRTDRKGSRLLKVFAFSLFIQTLHRQLSHGKLCFLSLNYMEFYTRKMHNIPYPTAFPYGNGMVLHFYQQQESSTTKIVHKVINKRLKTYVQSLHTGENFH